MLRGRCGEERDPSLCYRASRGLLVDNGDYFLRDLQAKGAHLLVPLRHRDIFLVV